MNHKKINCVLFETLDRLGLSQDAFPSLSIQRISPWIYAEAQISGVAVWLNQQHHSVTTPDPLNLTPPLRSVLTRF